MNKKAEIEGIVNFSTENGLSCVKISNKFANATIYLHGAHIASFIPKKNDDLLWMSKCSDFEDGKPIRGGIPVCWPWFGAHPIDSIKPSHGFARLAKWDVVESEVLDNGRTKVIFELNSTKESRAIWDYDFKLQSIVTIGDKLEVELKTFNCDTKSFTITSALHSYFNIGNIANVAITGLEDIEYVDTIDGDKIKKMNDIITFNEEVDRVYIDTIDKVIISTTNRKILISKCGSSTTVVWNPWIDKAKRMVDFGDNEYKDMVCVETTNALKDKITIEPQKSHSLKAIISTI